jgi:hypothetical protein
MTDLSRPQFRLRSLFILAAIVAVFCWAAAPVVQEIGAGGILAVAFNLGPILILVWLIANGKPMPGSGDARPLGGFVNRSSLQ